MATDTLGISGLGNGIGFVYITEPDGTTIDSSVANNAFSRAAIVQKGLTAGPLSGSAIAVGHTLIQVGGGTITNVTINGVSIMGVVAATGATPALLATDVATKVNSAITVPDYTAVADTTHGIVYYYAAPGTGSTPNGFVVVSSVTAPTTTVDTNMTGGSPASGVYDASFGNRFFINSNPAAVQGVLTGATEITANIVGNSTTSPVSQQTGSYTGGILQIVRNSSFQVINFTQDGHFVDVIQTAGFQDEDAILVVTNNTSLSTSFRDLSIATTVGANILLSNQATFVQGDNTVTIQLRYSATLNQWIEVSRTPSVALSTPSFRGNGFPAFPLMGGENIAVTLAGLAVTITPGTDKQILKVTGSGTLSGSFSIVPSVVAPAQGDWFMLDYRATITYASSFTVTIGSRVLTATQALAGTGFYFVYYGFGGVWNTVVLQNSPVDLATVTQLATKEAGLGTPAIAGYVLSSDLSNIRSWVPNASSPIVYSQTSNTGTPATTALTVLKTFTVPGGTLVNQGDQIEVEAAFVCAANADVKTMSLTFGATTVWTSASQAFSGEVILVRARISVVDGTNQSAGGGTLGSNVLPITPVYSTPTETISGNIVINAQGQNGTGNANDIICKHITIKVIKHV